MGLSSHFRSGWTHPRDQQMWPVSHAGAIRGADPEFFHRLK
jgi:hypothetical protein